MNVLVVCSQAFGAQEQLFGDISSVLAADLTAALWQNLHQSRQAEWNGTWGVNASARAPQKWAFEKEHVSGTSSERPVCFTASSDCIVLADLLSPVLIC